MVESLDKVISIKDDKFNPEYLSQYNLIICLSSHSIEVGVIDTIDNRVLSLERYPINGLQSHEAYVDSLSQIFENHYFLKAGYWKTINVVINNDKLTLLPKELFVDTYAREYLKLNCELNFVYDRIFWNHIEEIDVVNIYSIHNKVFDWLKDIYKGRKINFIHSTHIGILNCFNESTNYNNNISISIQDNFLQVVIFKDKKLNFCNSFKAKTTEDVKYFSHALMQQFGIKKNESAVEIYFSLENEEKFELLQDVFGYASKGKRCETKTFGFVFDEIEEHFFFNICNAPILQ